MKDDKKMPCTMQIESKKEQIERLFQGEMKENKDLIPFSLFRLIFECFEILLTDSIENLKAKDAIQAELMSSEATVRQQFAETMEERQILLDCVRRRQR
uniref:Uncharacterized protein n=1 Tax=viral metagenome TaxID=1070528 RepID=A0A6M3X5Y9_9ZZZZ